MTLNPKLDLRSISLYRILLGIGILYNLIERILIFKPFYSDAGVLKFSDTHWLFPDENLLSLFNFSSSDIASGILIGIGLVAGILVTLGVYSRWALVLLWPVFNSILYRNPLANYGADAYLSILVFVSIFIDLDQYGCLRPQKDESRMNMPFIIVSQIVIFYWFAGLFKLNSSWLTSNAAIFNSFSTVGLAKPLAHTLLAIPILPLILGPLVILFEFIGPLLLFINNAKLRIIGVALFVCFHFFIYLCLNLSHFSFVCCSAMALFLPSTFWDYLNLSNPKMISTPKAANRKTAWIPAVIIVLLFMTNLNTFLIKKIEFGSDGYEKLSKIVWLYQRWQLFGIPKRVSGFHFFTLSQTSSAETPIFPPHGRTPKENQSIIDYYPGSRWATYLIDPFENGFEAHQEFFGQYLCRENNANPNSGAKIKAYWHYLNTEDKPSNGLEFKKRISWEYDCQ